MPLEDLAAMPPPPPPMPAQALSSPAEAVSVKTCLRLADDIAHLPFGVDRPGLDSVVVLHEVDDRALLLDILHGRLHVTVAVDRAAHQHRGFSVPVPADLEARKALVHDGLFQHGLAPVLAAVERNVDGAYFPGARPGKAGHLVEARSLEVHAPGGVGDDRLALHHHAELTPLAFRHRIGVTRRLAAEVPRLLADLDAAQ